MGSSRVILTRSDTSRNMARFYSLDLQPDLFGGVVLIRNWGRIGTAGQERRDWFASMPDAIAEQDRWRRIKTGRGYRP